MRSQKNKKLRLAGLIAVIVTVCLVAGAAVFAVREDGGQGVPDPDAEISWTENDDGTYTFTDHMGAEGSLYAWYVLEDGEPIVKTQYTSDPTFTYDLEGNDRLAVKGFVRTYKAEGEEYEQQSYKVEASEILHGTAEPYEISDVSMPEDIDGLIDLAINEVLTDATIPAEKVLSGDGSEWEADLTIPVDWSCPDIRSRSNGFRINAFFFLDDVWEKYKQGDDVYGALIARYILDWARQNPEYEEGSWQWHDDATANRVLRWACFLRDVSDQLSEEEAEVIKASLDYQIQLLSTDGFHTDNHNHGMHQDIALLMSSLLCKNGDTQKGYIEKAVGRLGQYYDYVYTADGVHKEHSPFYARDTLISMEFLTELLREISPGFVTHISGLIEGASSCLIQMIMPDGNWPSIGDSSSTNGITALQGVIKDSEEYDFVSTGIGTAPPDNAVFDRGRLSEN